MELNYQNLKARQRRERDDYNDGLVLRTHRALSWLDHAERASADKDAQFISLWIAFNAAYANEFDLSSERPEQTVFGGFIKRLCGLDADGLLADIVWSEFSGGIRLLLDNQYIYRPFWECCEGRITKQEWRRRFANAKRATNKALAAKDTAAVLNIVFSRLYTLRNQILHGGATWNSKVNRAQLRDGAAILAKVVPSIIKIMMDHPKVAWGEPCYPVVEE